jgi:hypothetical protein
MGSSLSLHNNTDDIIMVKMTANTAVFLPLISGIAAVGAVALTMVTAGAAAPLLTIGGVAISGAAAGAGAAALGSSAAILATRTAVNAAETALTNGYERDGFIKVLPGHTYQNPKQTLSLNQRMWLIRLDKIDGGTGLKIRTADSSVWTGATDKSNITYNANDTKYFQWKTIDLSQSGGAQEQPRHAAVAPAPGGNVIADIRGGAIQNSNGGSSRLSGLVTGLLLASPLNNSPSGYFIGGKARNKLHRHPAAVRGLGAKPTTFGAKMGKHLGTDL